MRKREIILICIIMIGLGLFTSLSLLHKKEAGVTDTVMVNDLIKRTELNWGRLSGEVYSGISLDYTVIDLSGTVQFSTEETGLNTYQQFVNDTIANGNLLLDVNIDQKIVGKIIVRSNLSAIVNQERDQLKHTIFYIYFALILLILGYFLYLERKVFRPFRILRRFAANIAGGNLDVPVLMDKHNAFGAFTESFDLMREALKSARYNEYLANKSKKELVASLSHDIKNPVASIKAICETMALKSEDRRIEIIGQKADQIDKLISDMFQTTLEELGELKVKPEAVPSSFIAEIAENINYDGRIHMVSPIPECLIICDKLRLTQVIDNLVGNSNKYAKTQIHISAELKDTFLGVTVKDFGKGILPEELPYVWNKFYRGKNAENQEGSGLGLYLSKLFIEKMGGQIECFNDIDGFAVKLYLKLEGM